MTFQLSQYSENTKVFTTNTFIFTNKLPYKLKALIKLWLINQINQSILL